MNQGVMSTFKSYYLRNIFCKAIVTVEHGASDESGLSQLKTFWKGFTILDAIKNICGSPTYTNGWKKSWLQVLRNDTDRLKTSGEEVSEDRGGSSDN